MQRFNYPFTPVDSTEPSSEVGLNDTSTKELLESTGVNRYWRPGPGSAAIRNANPSSADCHINFGAAATIVATSSGVV